MHRIPDGLEEARLTLIGTATGGVVKQPKMGFGEDCQTSCRSRNLGDGLKQESLRWDLLLHFSDEFRRLFEDIRFSLSNLRFEVDPKRSYQFSCCVMEWRCHIETIWFVFRKWFEGLQCGGLVSVTFLPQVLRFCRGYRDAVILTGRCCGEF